MRNIDKVIEESIISGIQKNAKKIFERSQINVPVITGDLKRSGEVEETDKGSTIEYEIEYAHPVEFGRGEEDISSEIHEVYIKPYTRKDGVHVKGHYKKYKGRVISFQPPNSNEKVVRTITKIGERPARHFLTNAVLEEVPNFIVDIVDGLEENNWGTGIRIDVTFEKET